ncbi:hypothetical protein IAR55_005620 [Kwoniella newhampshirensis]|uniref:Clathrin/coatomer adaptor adaptin-like N-terminal domain-containing protein n=1 Tax=Kwoniella newhampshirensis TaxID=1651941 RepID=A0AAW0YGW9_9TREE
MSSRSISNTSTITSLPPYLTSGASSRAHHALLVKLHSAKSNYEEDEVIRGEIVRAKEVLGVRGQSTTKIAETVLILLHCAMLRHDSHEDLDFALVHAIHLAEGGKSIAERRIGYLYLVERLPLEHELQLLLINTIRKDLASSAPSHILLALHAIVQLPSHDLGPAVTPLLTAKALLRHKVPAVRQRTLEALSALQISQSISTLDDGSFPLSMSKIIKMLNHERDHAVLAVIFKLIRRVLETGAHRIENDEEREYIVEKVLEAAGLGGILPDSEIALDVLRLLQTLLKTHRKGTSAIERVEEWVTTRLYGLTSCRGWERAFLLDACRLSDIIQSVSTLCIPLISRLLHPESTSPSSSTSPPTLPSPNHHILALKCLTLLPVTSWDGQLGESEMSVIMEGVNSADDTVRRTTVRLLHGQSPDLTNMILEGYVDSLRSSTNLSLPFRLPTHVSNEEKIRLGRQETAMRGLEVVDVNTHGGKESAERVVKIMNALEINERLVWEDGVRIVLDRLRNATTPFSGYFTTSLFDSLTHHSIQNTSHTLLVISTTAACEYITPIQTDRKLAVDFFVSALAHTGPPVQELILVALVSLLSGLTSAAGGDGDMAKERVLEGARRTHKSGTKYIQKRCTEVIEIIEKDLLGKIIDKARSRSLPDILAALIQVHAEHKRRSTSAPRTPTSPPSARSPSRSQHELRYEAYETPRLDKRDRYRDRRESDSDDG